ncbi:origin recognition complex, subunit 6 [Nemania serpens]|nr:origin recognition complex, subunit 6 [Nemania serpens]
MSRTLEPTLYSLLPSYSTPLPQPLLELASSLLAQSRHSAGALKADEEVARSYACAHIACERLKISLDLPPIQVRPPIPPRLYKRLYSHLDTVLPSTSPTKPSRTRTPTSKAREVGLFGSPQRIPSRATPTKDASLAKYRPPSTAKGRKERDADGTPAKSASKPPPLPAKRKAGGLDSALPAWIRPTVQLLCKELDQDLIGRTVLAGMQTIVAPHGRRTNDQWVNDHMTPLLAAVYCLVAGQFHVIVNGRDLDSRQYSKIRKSVLVVLEHAQEKVAVPTMDEDELWIGWSDITPKNIDMAMAEIIKRDWQKDEWFAGFEDMVKRSEADANHSDDDADQDEDARISERLHVQRADTMFQSRWDMTDQKRQEYREWKDGILRRIEEIERSQATAMEANPIT